VGHGEGNRTGYELLKPVYQCFPITDFVPSLGMMYRYRMKVEDQCMTDLPFSPSLIACVSNSEQKSCVLFIYLVFLEGFMFVAGEYS